MIISTIYSAHTLLPGLVVFTSFTLSFNSPLRPVLFLILLLIKLNLEKNEAPPFGTGHSCSGLGLALGWAPPFGTDWLLGSKLVSKY